MEHDVEECVKRLHLEPGDIIIVRLPRNPEGPEAQNVHDIIKRLTGHEVLVSGPDISLEILPRKELP